MICIGFGSVLNYYEGKLPGKPAVTRGKCLVGHVGDVALELFSAEGYTGIFGSPGGARCSC